MFQNIIVTVLLVTVFHLSIAEDSINPGDINSFIQLVNLTIENEDEPEDQDSAIDSLIQQINISVGWVNNILEHSLDPFSTSIRIGRETDPRVEKLNKYQSRVDALAYRFPSLLSDYHSFNEGTINEFVTTCTSNGTVGLQETLRNIYFLVMPSNVDNDNDGGESSMTSSGVDGPNLFQYLQQILDGAPLESQCNRDISVHQRLYETYNSIIFTEVEGYIMSMFSYRWQKIKQNVSNEQEMIKAGANLVMRAEEYLLALKKALPAASRTYRRCDPYKQHRGNTFNELEGSIQLYLTSEIDANDDRSCGYECKDLTGEWARFCDPQDRWCNARPCRGYLTNCSSVGTSKVCPTGSDEVGRYQWIKNVAGSTYGTNDDCRNEEEQSSISWRGADHCNICLCTCIEENRPSTALRTFSVRPQLSNIDENMIITGVRIVAVTRVIQLQIRQGKLLANGRIDSETDKWAEIERFEYTQEVYGGGFYLLNVDGKKLMKVSEDYSFIWVQQRNLNLDELFWEPNYVVTGIKFGFSDPNNVDKYNWNLSPIQLEIRVTEFDYESGLLKTESDSSQWITAEDMKGRLKEYDNERTEFSTCNLDNPVRNKINVPDSTPNQRITFGISDYWKDAGQSTVPFFDSVPVTGLSVPIAGIGLFHKGAPEYGGFISLRTYSIDLSNRMKSEMKSNDADAYKPDFSDPMPYDIEVAE